MTFGFKFSSASVSRRTATCRRRKRLIVSIGHGHPFSGFLFPCGCLVTCTLEHLGFGLGDCNCYAIRRQSPVNRLAWSQHWLKGQLPDQRCTKSARWLLTRGITNNAPLTSAARCLEFGVGRRFFCLGQVGLLARGRRTQTTPL